MKAEEVQVELVGELAPASDVRRAFVVGAVASGILCTLVGAGLGFIFGVFSEQEAQKEVNR